MPVRGPRSNAESKMPRGGWAPQFSYRTVAWLLSLNMNTVQRVFQIKGWQVRNRPICMRARCEAVPSVATAPYERSSTDVCRIWAERDGGTGLVFCQPEIHHLGSHLRLETLETGVHHAALPLAECHGRARHPDAERTVRPSTTLQQRPACDARHRRLDQRLQQLTPT